MNIQPGLYQHYSGNFYRVLGVCRHSETLEAMVVYQSLYGDYGLWVRPLDMFKETITKNDETIPRFKFISEMWTQPPTLR
ncbi:MAG: DUF1653 domain-containing protein [Candidatus Paracaedibacteraceae bacterium]|nr:DUF1653 domain-containing protein [Candidatus Paracaedibacteraceae bacterium]